VCDILSDVPDGGAFHHDARRRAAPQAAWAGGLAATSFAAALGCSHGDTAPATFNFGPSPRTAIEAGTTQHRTSTFGCAAPTLTFDDAGVAGASADAAPPMATAISVWPQTLFPPFSTAIHDYYVRCSQETTSLQVTLTATSGSTACFMAPTPTPPTTLQTRTLLLAEGEAAVVGLQAGDTNETYWVRCLPHDFPRLAMTEPPDGATPSDGYYLVGNATVVPGDNGYAMVLDRRGVPVWFQETTTRTGPLDVDNLIARTLSYVPYVATVTAAFSGQFILDDLQTGEDSLVASSGVPLDPHELRVLPNGDYLVFSDPVITGVDLTGLGSFGADEAIVGCVIQEVTPSGSVVWEWSATDHFDPVKDTTDIETRAVGSGTAVVPFHCNSIDVTSDGDLLVSARDMDSVFLVSRATGAVLWKMGGATYTKEGAPYLQVERDTLGAFNQQHDARMQPDGTVSMFDDQSARKNPARGVIYAIDVAAGTAHPVWQFMGKGTSTAMGSFRILPDGSRVIGWGGGQPNGRAFTELDADGTILRELTFPDGSATYRAIKVPTSALDIDELRRATGPS
jgi:hypothetical protein